MAVSPHRASRAARGPLWRAFKAESFPRRGVRSLYPTALVAYRLALAEVQAYRLPSEQARASSSALASARVQWRRGHR